MIHFSCKTFDQLTVYELYEIMTLRQEVFVVEQNCPYQDCDGKDLASWHLCGKDDEGGVLLGGDDGQHRVELAVEGFPRCR